MCRAPSKIQTRLKKAGQRLIKIRQGRKSIAAYITEFERKLFEARADQWPDEARIILLVASLNRETQDRLEGKDGPETYTQLTAFLRRQESAFVSTSDTASTVADRQLNDDPMEIDVNRVRALKQRRHLLKDQCARCGGKGHWAKDCKIKSNVTSVRRPVVTKTARTLSSPTFDYFAELTDGESGDDEVCSEDG